LTRGDFALLTKQLGYIAYNLIDIAAHCSSSDSSCWMEEEAAVSVAGQVDGMQQPQSGLLPAVARLYPLSRTDPSGRYVRCGEKG
jgi:spore coat protein U-like protein